MKLFRTWTAMTYRHLPRQNKFMHVFSAADMNRIAEQSTVPWHTLSAETVFSRLESGTDGLPGDEAERRLSLYGRMNCRLPAPFRRGPSCWNSSTMSSSSSC
jgi:hypothetical protein